MYQEFRLRQWISNVRIINRENDVNETEKYLQTIDDSTALFDFLNKRKEIDQKSLLQYFKLKEGSYRWNYVEDKKYPCNETHSMIAGRLENVKDLPQEFLNKKKEEELWHIIYSVTDKIEYEKALKSFADKNNLDLESFYDAFKKFPPFPSNYGSYSAKAIKKLLPLMRIGKYWNEENIDEKTRDRLTKIINAEVDETIEERVREKAKNLTQIEHFQGLPEWLAKYVVYDRHSEKSDLGKWKTVQDLEEYLKSFRQHTLKNPIVEQVITETLRTVKDIWQHYGNGVEGFFDEIHIELGRDMKNSAAERVRITEQVTKNENTNLRIRALLAEMLNDNSVENVRPYSPTQQDILKIYEDFVLNSAFEIPEDIEKISKQAQPTSSELQRYKLWLEQKYRSPYTGEIIPLNKLFTPAYEIEHIIPQSRYFDDSFSNKVICETAVNKLKDNQTGLQFIQNYHGQIVELGMGKTAKVFTEEAYTDFVKQHYDKSRAKKNKLLALEIPEKMIERQMNDTRYISKFIMQALSNIVRANKEDDGANSKNVLASNGQITTKLKQDWGMDAIWNELILPRFERLNQITNTTHFTVYNDKHQKYLPAVPLVLQRGFQKKRIDHRHHAMDALVIACATRSHINFLNNQNALEKNKSIMQKQQGRLDLRKILCDKKYNDGSSENYQWIFKQPWVGFIPEAKSKLEQVVVSFKQNLRIINKTINQHDIIKDGEKIKVKQKKGESWAIRKSLHTPMPYSKKTYEFNVLKIAENLGKANFIIDLAIKQYADAILNQFNNKITEAQKFIKANPIKDENGKECISTTFKIPIEKFRRRQPISKLSNRGQGGLKTIDEVIKFINKVADIKLQQNLLNHLKNNDNDIDKAFNADGIEKFNLLRKIPVYKLPISENGSGRFPVGQKLSTNHKWVEADTGTNLFFAVYEDEFGNRSFETVPLNEVVVHQKLDASLSKNDRKQSSPIPTKSDKGKLLFTLSPNDLVYIPTKDELENHQNLNFKSIKQSGRIYRFVSCTGSEGHFVHNNYSTGIINNEHGTNNKSERMLDFKNTPSFSDEKGKPQMIKNSCWKIVVDKIGNIKSVLT